MKKGVRQFLDKDEIGLLDDVGVSKKTRGWSHILNDMALHNELTDVRTVNCPELSAYNVEVQEWFSYCAFLTPGH